MPTSIPTEPDFKRNGFTLVEMMVVIFLLGLASAAVILTLPSSGASARSEAERLAARTAAARDEAVLQASPVALWIRPSGYGFERRRDGRWLPLESKPLRGSDWENGTRLESGGSTRIVFDATGMPSAPATIELANSGSEFRVLVSASGDVSVAP